MDRAGARQRPGGLPVPAGRVQTKILRAEKLGSLKTVKDSMRADLRYAEIMARRHPAKLQKLGRGRRRPRRGGGDRVRRRKPGGSGAPSATVTAVL